MTAEIRHRDARLDAGALAGLLLSLRRLDRLLERAVACVPGVYGGHVLDDRFRGLHLAEADVTQLLEREPGEPAFGDVDSGWLDEDAPPMGSRLAWLAAEHGLERFEVDVIVLALACDVDLRYERLYAYLHDDVTRRRPTVALALDLFSSSTVERLARRAHFASDAPLARHRLIELGGDPSAPLLAQTLALDEQVTSFLLAQPTLDRRLVEMCRYVSAADDRASENDALADSTDDSPDDDARVRALADAIVESRARGDGLRVRIHGAHGAAETLITLPSKDPSWLARPPLSATAISVSRLTLTPAKPQRPNVSCSIPA